MERSHRGDGSTGYARRQSDADGQQDRCMIYKQMRYQDLVGWKEVPWEVSGLLNDTNDYRLRNGWEGLKRRAKVRKHFTIRSYHVQKQ